MFQINKMKSITKTLKMKIAKYLLLFAGIFSCVVTYAQDVPANTPPEGSLNSGTIQSQFDYLNSISNNFQEYKVVKKANLDKIAQNVTDSLDVFKEQLVSINSQLREQKAAIDQLNNDLKTSQSDLQQALDMKDSFSFMGMYIHKST